MFTGIIEDIGKIVEITSKTLSIDTKLSEIEAGDSISVNGVCLTVTKLGPKSLSFDFSPETASITGVNNLKGGDRVNLERALKMDGRLGGHFVTGHIEGTGKIVSIKNEGNSVLFEISLTKELNKYVVHKGSIAIDGVSLTVVKAEEGRFTVAIIPHTLDQTSLGQKKTGDILNIETDVMVKYAEKIFRDSEKTGLTLEKLKKYGF